MKFFRLTALILAGGLMAACASIVDGGPTKPVTIKSSPSGQRFVVQDEAGKVVQRGKTPSVINLPRSDGSYFGAVRYKVSLEGSSETKTVKSSPSMMYLGGNIFVGGLIGWLIVDPLNGAMYTLKPEEVVLRK